MFNDDIKKGWGWRPMLNVLLASPGSTVPSEGPARAVAIVTRSVYEVLGRGEAVNSEDIAISTFTFEILGQ